MENMMDDIKGFKALKKNIGDVGNRHLFKK